MEKIGFSYKQQQPSGNFDAIIIGSGMGGLTTAVLLAKKGKKVLMLERHYTIGGFTHVFKRKDYEWDVGVHYIGEVNNEKSVLYSLFNYITEGKIEWADMGEVYDKIIFGDKAYDFVKGKDNFIEQMKSYFPAPKDQVAIDRYIDVIYSTARAVGIYAPAKVMPKAIAWFFRPLMQRKFLKFASRSTKDVMEEITDNKELIGVLTGQFGDYGLPPEQSSFGMHAMVVKHYIKGGAYPVGGSSVIAKHMVPIIEQVGGEVYTNAEVAEIVVENGRAKGVKMADGKTFLAPIVVSNAGVYNTFEKLLPGNLPEVQSYKTINKNIIASASHACLYIGLKHTAEELGLPKSNYWIYPDNYDHDRNVQNFLDDPLNASLPVAYISFPGAKDPDFTNRFPGRTAIEVISFAPYDMFSKWEGSRWQHRGDDYEALKESLSQRMLEQLYKHVPQVKGKIDTFELSTPLTTKHFVNYQLGEIYGLTHSPERFSETLLRPKTKIKGLFLTGQDIITAGIGGALFSGVLTASSILRHNFLGDAKKAMQQKEVVVQ